MLQQQPQQQIKPRYEVEAVDGVFLKTVIKRVDDRNVETAREEPYGFNVYFPQGHSIRVANTAELKRLGFDAPPELINDDGDVVGTTATTSLKQAVKSKAASGK